MARIGAAQIRAGHSATGFWRSVKYLRMFNRLVRRYPETRDAT